MANDRVMILIPVFNEQLKIKKVIERIPPLLTNDCIVVDDASSDNSAEIARTCGAIVLSNSSRKGVGSAIKIGFEYFLKNNYDILIVLAGNNKDFPEKIYDLVSPIINEDFDFIQGSRYLHISKDFGHMPFYRVVVTKIHSLLSSAITGTKITDSTNGFRGYKKNVIAHYNNQVQHNKFNGYALEPYILMRSCIEGFKFKEVPVRKVYPEKKEGQTKITPILGWFDLLYPFYLIFVFKLRSKILIFKT